MQSQGQMPHRKVRHFCMCPGGGEPALRPIRPHTESGLRPHLPLTIAPGQYEKCEGAQRLSKSRPPLKCLAERSARHF